MGLSPRLTDYTSGALPNEQHPNLTVHVMMCHRQISIAQGKEQQVFIIFLFIFIESVHYKLHCTQKGYFKHITLFKTNYLTNCINS